MNILIVHAHENSDSFCSALMENAQVFFKSKGHKITITDLYKKNFDAVGSKRDFTHVSDSDYYKYASEQLYAHQNRSFTAELKEEMQAISNADVLIFNFPLWWFGMPAILKGWVDRVLAYGFAYGGAYGFFNTGRFAGKKAFISVTTGSPKEMYTTTGAHGRDMEDILKNIKQGILQLVGFEVLPTFVGYGVSRISKVERKEIVDRQTAYLNTHFSR